MDSVVRSIPLTGLRMAPSQAWGTIRIVPLIRERVRPDLRIALRPYRDDIAIVSLNGELAAPGVKYLSYIPHGLVVSWHSHGEPAVAFGTWLQRPDGKRSGPGPVSIRLMHRMVKREDSNRLRLLPLHVALEGFLALHFGGPEIAWQEYSKRAISSGLDPRAETAVRGWYSAALEEALRVFEIHEQQAGVLLFHADELLSAFVVSHPDDYRALHRSLLEDYYGELLIQYGWMAQVDPLRTFIPDTGVSSLADLRQAVDRMRAEWSDFHSIMAAGLLDREVGAETVYRAGPFHLQRFLTDLVPSEENHVGEAIVRDDGTLEYLKTFRLSSAQTKRAYLLKQLAAQDWDLELAAASLKCRREDLIVRLKNAGFGYLVHEHVLKAAEKQVRERLGR